MNKNKIGVTEFINHVLKTGQRNLSAGENWISFGVYSYKMNTLLDIISGKAETIGKHFKDFKIVSSQNYKSDNIIFRGINIDTKEIEDIVEIEFDILAKETTSIKYSELLREDG